MKKPDFPKPRLAKPEDFAKEPGPFLNRSHEALIESFNYIYTGNNLYTLVRELRTLLECASDYTYVNTTPMQEWLNAFPAKDSLAGSIEVRLPEDDECFDFRAWVADPSEKEEWQFCVKAWADAKIKAAEVNEERRPLIEAWERYEKWLDLKKQMEELENEA